MTDRDVNGITVVDIEGRIVLGEESNAFRERVKALLAAGKKKIVLNMAQVSYIDSAGLGTLVATFHSARSQGATLETREPRREIPGSLAGHEADDGLRYLPQRSRRRPKLPQVTSINRIERGKSNRALFISNARLADF